MINTLSKVYGIKQNEKSKQFFNTLVELGTVSVAARSLINALKAIPGINLAASVLNSIIAGVIVAALGESTIYAFEQIYLGNKSLSDIDWVKQLLENKYTLTFVNNVKPILKKLEKSSGSYEILNAVWSVLKALTK